MGALSHRPPLSGLSLLGKAMPFALSPVKSELDPVRLAGALFTQELQRKAQAEADEKAKAMRAAAELQKVKDLIEHTVHQMDLNRFRMAYALGAPADTGMLQSMTNDFILALKAEEVDDHPDRFRRHILMHGMMVIHRLHEGMPVSLAHVNGLQAAAEMAMKILPGYSMKAIVEAARTLNKLWVASGVKGADRTMPQPKQPFRFKARP